MYLSANSEIMSIFGHWSSISFWMPHSSSTSSSAADRVWIFPLSSLATRSLKSWTFLPITIISEHNSFWLLTVETEDDSAKLHHEFRGCRLDLLSSAAHGITIAISKHAQTWGQIWWKSVQLVRGASFRNGLLQNTYFSFVAHRISSTDVEVGGPWFRIFGDLCLINYAVFKKMISAGLNRVSDISEKLDFWWSIPQKGTGVSSTN